MLIDTTQTALLHNESYNDNYHRQYPYFWRLCSNLLYLYMYEVYFGEYVQMKMLW